MAGVLTLLAYFFVAVITVILCIITSVFIWYHTIRVPVATEDRSFYKFFSIFIQVSFFIARCMSYVNGKDYGRNFKSIAQLRERDTLPGLTRTDIEEDGVKLFLYRATGVNAENQPAIIFIHGGGWLVGSPHNYQIIFKELCERLGAAVIAVSYRLSPDHLFPTAYNDCFNACKWFLQHHEDYQIDGSRIAIEGDSAGGQLAASVVQGLVKDNILPRLKLQILIYPVIQGADFNTPSYQQDHGGALTKELMMFFYANYLVGSSDETLMIAMGSNSHLSGDMKPIYTEVLKRVNHKNISDEYKYPPYQGSKLETQVYAGFFGELQDVFVDFRLSPLFGELHGVPPAYVVTCGIDVLRDDGVLYVEALKEAGVQTVHQHYKEGQHGMVPVGKFSKEGTKAREELMKFLKDTL